MTGTCLNCISTLNNKLVVVIVGEKAIALLRRAGTDREKNEKVKKNRRN